MIVIVGKTCSGKSTVADLLEKNYKIKRIRTYTTRPKRQDETDEYHYVSVDEFMALKKEGFFFETTKYEVASGDTWYYGTAKDDLDRGKCIVMNPEGLKKLKDFLRNDYFKIKIIYLNVTKGVQYDRLKKRGTDADEAKRRVDADEEDFKDIDQYYDISITTDDMEPDHVTDLVFFLSMAYLVD